MQPKENREFFSDGRNVTVTFSHLLFLLPSYVSPQESPWTEAPSREHFNICVLQLWCLIPLLWPPLQVLGKQRQFWGDSVSLTLCLSCLKQLHVSVWEKGKPAILAQGCSGSDPSWEQQSSTLSRMSARRGWQHCPASAPVLGSAQRGTNTTSPALKCSH